MNIPISLDKFKDNSFTLKLLLFILLAFIIVFIGLFTFISIAILNNQTVYTGVFLDKEDIGGKTRDQLNQFLDENYLSKMDKVNISFFYEYQNNIYTKTVSLDELGVRFDKNKTIENIYSIGREGNILARLNTVRKLHKTPSYSYSEISYDRDKLDQLINTIAEDIEVEVVQPELVLYPDKVYLSSGTFGYLLDREDLSQKIVEQIRTLKDEKIIPYLNKIMPTKINVDTIYNEIICEPADSYAIVEDGKLKIIPHQIGRRIEKESLSKLITDLEARTDKNPVTIEIPILATPPEITTDKARALALSHTLTEHSTWFSTSDENSRNRAVNIGLAVKKIDGLILASGEEFSFNNIVGDRSVANGYRIAKVYENGRIVDGIGGGICQVSTTLFNAALVAGLKITSRSNHMFTVSYAPPGLDATVSYGSTDFKFVNSFNWPIQLSCSSENNKLTFSIKGTNEYPEYKYKTITKPISETPYQTIYKEDPSLPPGTQKVVEQGHIGQVVEAYRLKLKNGEVEEHELIGRSSYLPHDEVIIKGPALPAPTDAPSVQ